MSPVTESVLLVASAFVLGELILTLSRSRGMPVPQALSLALPRFVAAALIGAAIGYVLNVFGIKVAP